MSIGNSDPEIYRYRPNQTESLYRNYGISTNNASAPSFSSKLKQNQSDSFSFANYENSDKAASLKEELNSIKKQQGFIGKLWNGFKNITKIGAGSNKAKNAIEKFEKGKITEEEAIKALEGYKAGQTMCVDVAADIASGILAVGAFAFAVPTGGASLAVGLSLATAVGAGTKIAIKATDAITTGKKYGSKELLYDTLTGAVNGLLSPVTNGIGASLTKTVGTKLGLTVIKEGVETTVEQGVKQTVAQGIKSVITTQGIDVAGGTIAKRTLALGAGMAIDGALGGASDNMVRAALNGENVIEAGIQGAIGGAIMSPVIGGGFRAAGKAGRSLNNEITMRKLLPDGLNTTFKQGQAGDCALLSVIDGMMNRPSAAKLIKKSITKDLGGNYNVKIGNKIVKIAKSSITDEMLSDKTGIKVFEQAYKQISGSLDGDFAETVAKNFGLNPVHIPKDSLSDELLDNIAKQQDNLILSLGANIDSEGAISTSGTSKHYFTIKNIDTDSKTISLTSPFDTSKKITLTYDEAKSLGLSIDGGSISKTNNLPNITRNIDEETFKGRNIADTIDYRKYGIEKGEFINTLDQLDITVEKFKSYLGRYSVSEDDFFAAAKTHGIETAFKGMELINPIKNSYYFNGMDLALEDCIYIRRELSDMVNNNFNPAKIQHLSSFSEYLECLSPDEAFHLHNSIETQLAYSTFEADNLLYLGKINGKEKYIACPDKEITSTPAYTLPGNMKFEFVRDLVKSNLVTSELLDSYSALEAAGTQEAKMFLSKLRPTVKVKYPEGDINISFKTLIDKARKNIESLSSEEIHALTVFFERSLDFPIFKKELTKQLELGKINMLAGKVKKMREIVSRYSKNKVQISDHALMRFLDRDLLSIARLEANGEVKIYSFTSFMDYLAKNKIFDSISRCSKNDFNLEGFKFEGEELRFMTRHNKNGSIIIDSIC